MDPNTIWGKRETQFQKCQRYAKLLCMFCCKKHKKIPEVPLTYGMTLVTEGSFTGFGDCVCWEVLLGWWWTPLNVLPPHFGLMCATGTWLVVYTPDTEYLRVALRPLCLCLAGAGWISIKGLEKVSVMWGDACAVGWGPGEPEVSGWVSVGLSPLPDAEVESVEEVRPECEMSVVSEQRAAMSGTSMSWLRSRSCCRLRRPPDLWLRLRPILPLEDPWILPVPSKVSLGR